MKHGAIPDAVLDSWVGRIEDRLYFFHREMFDNVGIGFLCGDRQNAVHLL